MIDPHTHTILPRESKRLKYVDIYTYTRTQTHTHTHTYNQTSGTYEHVTCIHTDTCTHLVVPSTYETHMKIDVYSHSTPPH
jgi:hypothetical protein